MHPLNQIAWRLLFATAIVASLALLGQAVGFASPWFGVTASFCVLGLLDLATPFARLRMPRRLRKLRTWEMRGGVYQSLGVPAFGALLRHSPLRLLNRNVYLTRLLRDLTALPARMEQAEAAHFWGGVATLPYLGFACAQDREMTVICVIVFNVIVNLYPIFHLRSVRARVEQALLRKNALYAQTDTT
jgi:hypothetical protein